MHRGKRVGVIVPAAGSGRRMGASVPKALIPIGGTPIIVHTLWKFQNCGEVDDIVVVVRPGDHQETEAALAGTRLGKVRGLVPGGEQRQDSVRAGLAALMGRETGIVVVHDAVRPFVEQRIISGVIAAAHEHGAAVAAVRSKDTVKILAKAGSSPETPDRDACWLAQTPQGFRRELLVRAYEAAGAEASLATDECSLIERIGAPVTLVPGEPGNFKITGPDDLERARAALEAPVALGVGYDTHRFAPGRRLVLGGVEFEGDGLLGHSDADVCAHAIGDAILGAAGLGDLGRHFPDTDPRWKGVSSLVLLAEIARKAAERGWRVGNCDVTLAARRPKVAPRAEEMRERIASALGISPGQVNVKATTGEGMGFVGREEGIAAHAVALLVRVAR